MLFESPQPLTLRVINALYVEAMVLADEARAYFDQASADARQKMAPLARVTFSCESLKATTRLMHVVAWLLEQRAVAAELGRVTVEARLGTAEISDPAAIAGLPEDAARLIRATSELYDRIKRLDTNIHAPFAIMSPARQLQSRLVWE